MKRKPYPTFAECVKMGRKPQIKESKSDIMERFNEIPQDKYGGINVESLVVSNLMESLTRFDFKDFR